MLLPLGFCCSFFSMLLGVGVSLAAEDATGAAADACARPKENDGFELRPPPRPPRETNEDDAEIGVSDGFEMFPKRFTAAGLCVVASSFLPEAESAAAIAADDASVDCFATCSGSFTGGCLVACVDVATELLFRLNENVELGAVALVLRGTNTDGCFVVSSAAGFVCCLTASVC